MKQNGEQIKTVMPGKRKSIPDNWLHSYIYIYMKKIIYIYICEKIIKKKKKKQKTLKAKRTKHIRRKTKMKVKNATRLPPTSIYI